jgi:hypothetical protein
MQENETTLAAGLEQVLLLSGQDYFRNDKALLDLLNRALVRHADDVDHMKRMVSAWILSTRKALHPADVFELAERTANRVGLPEPCDTCRTNPWPNIVEKNGASGAARCNCPRGERLEKADKEYAARPAPSPEDDRQLTFLKEFLDPRENSLQD